MNVTFEDLLATHRIEACPAAEWELAAGWEKARTTLRSARVLAADPESAVTLAYHAAAQCAVVVLRTRGFRVIPSEPDPDVIGYVAELDDESVARVARDVAEMRTLWWEAVFGSRLRIGPTHRAMMDEAAERFFRAAYRWLRQARPELVLSAPDQPA